ncbi:TetR/AcrR family transcriptional regulator [Nocardia sp. NBC_00403]|uniref:TetR/AcrR family transcriptional regulator n=1 Tax=Nocardia sp. NBC_00403 TaxID=2975990 RepID=UPI002E242F05
MRLNVTAVNMDVVASPGLIAQPCSHWSRFAEPMDVTVVNTGGGYAILDVMTPAAASADRHRPYHHGSLRAALVDAGIVLAREGGPDRVVLREAARAAGVSHSAAYRHFADREALLAEVSRQARSELASRMRHHIDDATDPVSRLGAVGTAYVDFALTEPGLFRTAFDSHPTPGSDYQHDPSTTGEVEPQARGAEPFDVLNQVLDEVQSAGLLDPRRRPGAAIAAWSAIHGLASLLIDGPLPTTKADIDFALGQVLELVARGLLQLPQVSDGSPSG